MPCDDYMEKDTDMDRTGRRGYVMTGGSLYRIRHCRGEGGDIR